MQPDARITVLVEGQVKPTIEIVIHRTLTSPAELISAAAGASWTGLVSLESYGRDVLRRYRFAPDSSNSPMLQAIPYAMKQIVREIRFTIADFTTSAENSQTASGKLPSYSAIGNKLVRIGHQTVSR